jgi:tRNA threonylcarbamoyladenosine biosynthesis protein TsaE
MQKKVFKESQIGEIAKFVIASSHSKIICLNGPMGVGKTTLIKGLVKELGGTDPVSSPTFGIVNEYHGVNDELLAYHFDFYRMENEMEALDLGFDDYLNQNAWIFIEWAENISSLIPEKASHIFLELNDELTRSLRFA